MNIINISNLKFQYSGKYSPALDNISLCVEAGEFVILSGESGCGKTTLLRLLKPAVSPAGEISGSILFKGLPISSYDSGVQSSQIGFVMQNPSNQIVTDKVWHELAFGPESLGMTTEEIRLRVSETASYFGIQNWFERKTEELSGGQKQLLCLASIMVMQPELLILDEPLCRLDPISSSEFISAVKKVNQEIGVTVIMASHQLEGVIESADRIVVMDKGRIVLNGSPREAGRLIHLSRLFDVAENSGEGIYINEEVCNKCLELNDDDLNRKISFSMPAAYRIFSETMLMLSDKQKPLCVENSDISVFLQDIPLSIREGRRFINQFEDNGLFRNRGYEGDGEGSGNCDGSGKSSSNGEGKGEGSGKSNSNREGEGFGYCDGIRMGSGKGNGFGNCDGDGNGKLFHNRIRDSISSDIAIKVSGIHVRYDKAYGEVLKGLSFSVNKNEIFAITGGNGTGKTTCLKSIMRLIPYQRGKIEVFGHDIRSYKSSDYFGKTVGYLPQDPQVLFVRDTVLDDLNEVFDSKDNHLNAESTYKRCRDAMSLCGISHLESSHPYDLSGGEQQRAALAKILLLSPSILLLDEPTNGLDTYFKEALVKILKKLKNSGMTIIFVSHDLDFCALCADRCLMLFDGLSVGEPCHPRQFFAGKSYYTTTANKIARNQFPEAVTVEDVISGLCCSCSGNCNNPGNGSDNCERNSNGSSNRNGNCNRDRSGDSNRNGNCNGKRDGNRNCNRERNRNGNCNRDSSGDSNRERNGNGKRDGNRNRERKGNRNCNRERNGNRDSSGNSPITTPNYNSDQNCPISTPDSNCNRPVSNSDHHNSYPVSTQDSNKTENLTKDTCSCLNINNKHDDDCNPSSSPGTLLSKISLISVIPCMAATVLSGMYLFDDRKYYFISFLLLLEISVPLLTMFERDRHDAAELVLYAVMSALCVASRLAFYMLPEFKPVTAIVVVSGFCLGSRSGLLIGSLSMLISNIFFGQGPWTPWQMLSMGLIGLTAGLLSKHRAAKGTRIGLAIFGAAACLLIYSPIMNIASVLIYQPDPTIHLILSACMLGLPMDIIHALSTAAILFVFSRSLIKKLKRTMIKYDLNVN